MTDVVPYRYEDPIPLDETIFTPLGLQIDIEGMAFSEWQRLGDNLRALSESYQWWIGDWFKLGEGEYGQDAYGVFSLDRFDDTTIQKFHRVAMVYPYEERRPELSWSHHKEAAPLPKDLRDKALQWAIDNEKFGHPASVADMADHIKKLKALETTASNGSASTTTTRKTQITYTVSFTVYAEHESAADGVWEELIETQEALTHAEELDARFENSKG